MQLYVHGIGIWASGINGWSQARAVLRGEQPYTPQISPLPASELLHAAERRRAPSAVKLAVHVAAQACIAAAVDAAALPCVFASSHGDTEISDYMCAELAQPQPALSPTRFHNSVHNAASGYWTIAVGCRQAANATTTGPDTFANGWLEAVAQLIDGAEQVLLVVYDITAPRALLPLCPLPQTFGMAMVLGSTARDNTLASVSSGKQGELDKPRLREFVTGMMHDNPAARSLPLLTAIADEAPSAVLLAGHTWNVAPCR